MFGDKQETSRGLEFLQNSVGKKYFIGVFFDATPEPKINNSTRFFRRGGDSFLTKNCIILNTATKTKLKISFESFGENFFYFLTRKLSFKCSPFFSFCQGFIKGLKLSVLLIVHFVLYFRLFV